MCFAKKEIKDNQFLYENIKDDLIKNRAASCLKWFIRKAVKNKYLYYLLSVLTILCPVISEITINIGYDNFYVRVISSVILGISTIAASFLTLFDVRRKWGIYRDEAENLKRILALSGSGVTEKWIKEQGDKDSNETIDEATKEKMMLLQMEQSMILSHQRWMEPFQKKEK